VLRKAELQRLGLSERLELLGALVLEQNRERIHLGDGGRRRAAVIDHDCRLSFLALSMLRLALLSRIALGLGSIHVHGHVARRSCFR